jgi:transposase
MFAWYWVADLCQAEGIPFVLGHALYMKAVHGGKTKNDKIDSHKIATLLRGGTLAQAYVYPKGMRETRDLLRRRSFLVRHRALLIAHIQNEASQYNLPVFAKKLTYAANREECQTSKGRDRTGRPGALSRPTGILPGRNEASRNPRRLGSQTARGGLS